MDRPRLAPLGPDDLTVVPANEASWQDLQAVLGMRGYAAHCQCQRFKTGHYQWSSTSLSSGCTPSRPRRTAATPARRTTSGLVAYLDGEPVGWCAVEPRTAYPGLPRQRTVMKARGEDPADPSVWAVTCFATRAGFRRRGVTRVLAQAAVDFARERGARALEAYPMITDPGEEITWGETHVGTRSIFEAAGLTEVAHPTLRRVVMRIEFPDDVGPDAAEPRPTSKESR